MRNRLLPVLASLLLTAGLHAADPTPKWLWSGANGGANEEVAFRKSFTVEGKPASAKLSVTCDNHATVWVNGQQVAKTDEWKEPATVDIAKHLVAGANVIAVLGKNDEAGLAGVVARLVLKDAAGKTTVLVSDASWKLGSATAGWEKPAFDDGAWKAPHDLGALGKDPWGDVLANAGKPGGGGAITPADQLTLPPGFKAEVVYTVPKGEQGSWVSITSDPKGRLIASDQNGALYRITPMAPGADAEGTKVEKLDVAAGSAQGLLWAYDSLYVMISGNYAKNGSGIYRLQDTDNNDSFDKVTKLRAVDGGGEHGPHGLALGPDGKIYFVAGNFTKLPEPFDSHVASKNWKEDILLPRHWDANGHAQGTMAPGGWIARTDAEGKSWELVGIGYRNAYDVAFNAEGELFSWDSDMEWDMGTPWYRPTRATHTPPGADFGWRSGSGNPPGYYADSLPPLMDIGPGSPVGVLFGTGAKFPAKYQKALYILDWTFGTMYALILEPNGASYRATKEEFLFGRPLPLTDAIIAKDGAMYVAVGGRGTQSGIYRVTYSGSEATTPAPITPANEALVLRRKLEAFLGKSDAGAVAAAWPHLGHGDRFVRFAARGAIEAQPAAGWQDKVFGLSEPRALINALVAFARCGDKELQAKGFAAWQTLDLAKLDSEGQLDALRALSLLITRMGQPDEATAKALTAKVEPLFPSADYRLNRDLASTLTTLGSPTATAKIVAQMLKDESLPPNHDLDRLIERNGGYGGPIAQMVSSKPVQQRMHYANALSIAKQGWTPEARKAYFTWFEAAERDSKGGNSFKGFIRMIRKQAWENVPEAERAELAPEKLKGELAALPPAAPVVQPKGPGKEWTVDELAPLAKGMKGRSFTNGRNMFIAAQCTVCHRFAGDGGAAGPDISTVATKFSARDLLESIVEPSKVISDQYNSYTIITKDGRALIGRVLSDDGKNLTVATNPTDASVTAQVAKADVLSKTVNKASIMPIGLMNRLNQDEALDLLAYLLSSGNEKDPVFAK